MSADAILLSKYKKNRPENAFRKVVSTREVYGEKWRIFRGQKFSGALRNTRKSFRELCGAVSGPEKFSGLLRNARQFTKVIILLFGDNMYDFKQDWFRKSGITKNSDGCYEVKRAPTSS